MKRLLLYLVIIGLIGLLGYLMIDFTEPVQISWMKVQIDIDIFVLLLFWLVSVLSVMLIVSLLRLPRRVANLFKDLNTIKSLQHYADASFSLVQKDYPAAQQALTKIKRHEVAYQRGLLQAYIYTQTKQRLELDQAIRQLLKNHPDKQSEINYTYWQWLLEMGDTQRTFELIQTELQVNNQNRQAWLAFLQVSEQSANFKPWIEWQKQAKPLLDKQPMQRLEVGLACYHLKQSESQQALKQHWQSVSKKARNDADVWRCFVNQAMLLNADIDYFHFITAGLKKQWHEDWLWQIVNYPNLNKIHDLIEWLRRHHPLNAGDQFYLCMAVLCCRQKLWAIARDYLQKTQQPASHKQVFQQALLDAWITSNLEQHDFTEHLQQLMHSQGMLWFQQPSKDSYQ